MILWFTAIGACGVNGIADNPEILKALSPTYALTFMADHFHIAFFALAAVVLAVTGAEALYADMGHFGRRAITLGWLGLVLPACTLSYFGQGALVLADEKTVAAPFFLLTPEWARIPMVLLATAATVIASQAVISARGATGRDSFRGVAIAARSAWRRCSGERCAPERSYNACPFARPGLMPTGPVAA